MKDIGVTNGEVQQCPNMSTPMLPFERTTVLELAPLFRTLQAQAPAVRVRTPTGDPAWLVSRYDDVKALLASDQLSRSHPNPERASRMSKIGVFGAPMEDYATEQAFHDLLRKAGSAFSIRRMNLLRPHIQEIVDELLDAIDTMTPPVDVHENFSALLPARVICELLGVPFSDRTRFSAMFDAVIDPADGSSSAEPLIELMTYVGELIAEKQQVLGDDVISHVIRMRDSNGSPTDNEIVVMVGALLFAGYSTVTMFLDLGAVLLLTDSAHRAPVLDDVTLSDAVEELLRFLVPGFGVIPVPRYARTDIRIGEVTIPTGDAVLLSLAAANHDGATFEEPNRFDPARRPNPHLAFGHGRHFCVGASLARIELQVALQSLFRRLPTLRLAIPVEELRLQREFLSVGLAEVPVVW